MSRKGSEKACVEARECTAKQFRARSEKGMWKKNCYRRCYDAIFIKFGIENDRRNNNRARLIAFLNAKDIDGRLVDEIEIGEQREHFEHSYAESPDEDEEEAETSRDVTKESLNTSVQSLDEPQEVLQLKRALTEANLEING